MGKSLHDRMNVVDKMVLAAGLMRGYLTPLMCDCLVEVARYRKPYVLADGIPNLPNMEELASNNAFGAIALLNARPVAYLQENGGNFVREVRPQPGKASEKSSHGKAELPMHTDMTYLRFPKEKSHPLKTAAPDFLILSCVWNGPGVATRLVTLEQILNALGEKDINALYKPKFTFRTPDSVAPPRTISGRSILYDHSELGSMIRYNDVYCTPEIDEGRKALASLQAFIRDARTGTDIVLMPGKVLVFNNRLVLHGRSAIPDRKNGNGESSSSDRWFKRVYAQRHDTEYCPVKDKPLVQKG